MCTNETLLCEHLSESCRAVVQVKPPMYSLLCRARYILFNKISKILGIINKEPEAEILKYYCVENLLIFMFFSKQSQMVKVVALSLPRMD